MPLSLILFAIAIVFSVTIIIRFYPLILVNGSKIFFGKYSTTYLLQYKKFFGTSPYGYCTKDDFINHIAGFYNSPGNRKIFQTTEDICFESTKYGEKFSNIIKGRKKPVCLNVMKLPHFDLRVVGFRSEIFDSEMKAYYYFANNQFFMGEYSFKITDKEKIKAISSALLHKYLKSETVIDEDFLIENSNQAAICFEHNGFNLSIKYLTFDDEKTRKLLNSYWESKININFRSSISFETDVRARQ